MISALMEAFVHSLPRIIQMAVANECHKRLLNANLHEAYETACSHSAYQAALVKDEALE